MNAARKRRLVLASISVSVTLAISLFLAELVVGMFAPVSTLSPRYDHSDQYGLIPYPNVQMRNEKPGHYDFRYTVSASRTRGRDLPDPTTVVSPAVVVLGDSNSFGLGVNDGEEFPARLQQELGDLFVVINLGEPGWGLTQQIRRYREMGSRYKPAFVIVQFCENDPNDNVLYPVTVLQDGELSFVDMPHALSRVFQQLLSRSFLQRSQLYNGIRQRAFTAARQLRLADAADPETKVDTAAETYAELLEAFATQIHFEGPQLVLISVTGELEKIPLLLSAVKDLQARGLIHYVDTRPWFEPGVDYRSAEGHAWGAEAQTIVGRRLAEELARIRTAYR